MCVSILIQTAFYITQDASYCESKNKVDRCDNKERLEVLVSLGCNSVPCEVKFHNRDNIQHRGIFNINDELITSGWQDVTDNLWKNNLAHGLTVGKTKSSSSFELPLINSEDTTTNNFTHVGSGVNRNNEYSCQCTVNIDAKSLGSTVIDNHRLYNHWCTTENFDINVKKPTEDFLEQGYKFISSLRSCTVNTNHKTDKSSDNSTDNGDKKCYCCTTQELWPVFSNNSSHLAKEVSFFSFISLICRLNVNDVIHQFDTLFLADTSKNLIDLFHLLAVSFTKTDSQGNIIV